MGGDSAPANETRESTETSLKILLVTVKFRQAMVRSGDDACRGPWQAGRTGISTATIPISSQRENKRATNLSNHMRYHTNSNQHASKDHNQRELRHVKSRDSRRLKFRCN